MTLAANCTVCPLSSRCHKFDTDSDSYDYEEKYNFEEVSSGFQSSNATHDLGCLIEFYQRQIHQAMASSKVNDTSQTEFDVSAVKFNTQSEELVFAGGLQQFLIREARKHKDQQLCQQPRICDGSSPSLTFHDLPDSLQLHIFSYLDAIHLCRMTTVCKHWLMLSSDELLWQNRLRSDIDTWWLIANTSNPDSFSQQEEDWPCKEIYLRCSPVVSDMMRKEHRNFSQISSLFRSFLPKRTPKFALFGPGLESSTSGIVRKIIEQETELFKAVGMFPGNHGGVGSGFIIKMANSLMFHLSTLYASNRKDRENWQQGDRLKNHRLLQRVNGEEDDDEQYILKDTVKEFCSSLDALIFVVDATQQITTIAESRAELCAHLQAVSDKVNLPVLVLSCLPDRPSQPREHLSCMEVVRALNLSTFTHPWQVHQCEVESLTGLENAFRWVAEHCNRR